VSYKPFQNAPDGEWVSCPDRSGWWLRTTERGTGPPIVLVEVIATGANDGRWKSRLAGSASAPETYYPHDHDDEWLFLEWLT
jgi:hypothetical protein